MAGSLVNGVTGEVWESMLLVSLEQATVMYVLSLQARRSTCG